MSDLTVDSKDVEDSKESLFEVRSLLKPVPMKIERLKRGQTRLDLRPSSDCLVYVENENRKIYIRRGLNQSDGTEQKEVFILRRDGSMFWGHFSASVRSRIASKVMRKPSLKGRSPVTTSSRGCFVLRSTKSTPSCVP